MASVCLMCGCFIHGFKLTVDLGFSWKSTTHNPLRQEQSTIMSATYVGHIEGSTKISSRCLNQASDKGSKVSRTEQPKKRTMSRLMSKPGFLVEMTDFLRKTKQKQFRILRSRLPYDYPAFGILRRGTMSLTLSSMYTT